MDQKKMFKQVIDFNSAAFDNSFSTMVALQDQMEKTTSALSCREIRGDQIKEMRE